MKKGRRRLMGFGMLLLVLLVPAVAHAGTPPATLEYRVARVEHYNHFGRERIKVFILTDLKPFVSDRGSTAMNAARELVKKYRADIVSVHYKINHYLLDVTNAYAIVHFAPDGGGFSGHDGWTWKTFVDQRDYRSSDLTLIYRWENHKTAFKDEYGLTNDKQLRKFLSEKYGYSYEDTEFPQSEWAISTQ